MIYGTNITYHQSDDYEDHPHTTVVIDEDADVSLIVYYQVTRKGTIEVTNDYRGDRANEDVTAEPEVRILAVHQERLDMPDDTPLLLHHLEPRYMAEIQETFDILAQPESEDERFWDVEAADHTFTPSAIMRKNGWAR